VLDPKTYDDVYVSTVPQARELVEVMDLRPPMPYGAPSELISLLTDCWQRDPRRRPTFDEIIERLELYLTQSEPTDFDNFPFATE
jgi:hypothetical protein